MCTIWKQTSKSISVEFLSRAFEDGVLSKDLEYLGLTGGEPTLLDDLPEYTKFIIDKSPHLQEISLNTNGFLSARVIEMVKRLLNIAHKKKIKFIVYVSLDGTGEIHDAVRGMKGAFEKVEFTIKELKNILQKEEMAELAINSVVTRMNADKVTETFKYAKSIDIPINFSLVMSTDTCINSKESDTEFEILSEQVPGLRRFFSKMKMISHINGDDSLEYLYYQHILNMLQSSPRDLMCPFAEGIGCLIDPSGDVYPCGISEKLHMGNVLETPFGDIWRNYDIRRRLNTRLPAFCSHCESNCFIHASESVWKT